jgi:hypothetical protein
MLKQKTYAFICLASLLLFFQTSILFISDVLISFHVEDSRDFSDIGDQENTNRLANPLEEETLHSSISITCYAEILNQLEKENGHYLFKLKTSYQKNTTPPPKHV